MAGPLHADTFAAPEDPERREHRAHDKLHGVLRYLAERSVDHRAGQRDQHNRDAAPIAANWILPVSSAAAFAPNISTMKRDFQTLQEDAFECERKRVAVHA